jgi:hypothetical protein
MGVAPEAIVEKMCFEYRLKYSVLHHHTSTRHSFVANFVECTLSALDSSSPRGYSRMFSGIVLSIDYCTVGANLMSSLMSTFIRKPPYLILRRVHASVSLFLRLHHDVIGQF